MGPKKKKRPPEAVKKKKTGRRRRLKNNRTTKENARRRRLGGAEEGREGCGEGLKHLGREERVGTMWHRPHAPSPSPVGGEGTHPG